jgi:hypothetical protein
VRAFVCVGGGGRGVYIIREAGGGGGEMNGANLAAGVQQSV